MASSSWFPIIRTGLTTGVRLLAAAVALCGVATGARAAPASFGFTEIRSDGVFLHLPLAPQDIREVVVQYPDAQGRNRCCIRLRNADLMITTDPSPVEVVDPPGDVLVRRYAVLHQRRLASRAPFVALALANVRGSVRSGKATMSAIDDGGTKLSVRRCLGSEGINASTAAVLSTRHLYFSLGYEIDLSEVGDEPVCGAAPAR